MPKYEDIFPVQSSLQVEKGERLDPALAAMMGFSDDQL